MPSISSLSNQTIYALVRNEVPIDGEQNISALPVEMAVVALGTDPVAADWFAATWKVGTKRVGRKNFYVAYLEIGPGGATTLEPGAYRVWVRVTAATETPVIPGPTLTVT